MALGSDVAARRQHPLLLGQIVPQCCLEGVGGAALTVALGRRRVLAQTNAGVQIGGRLPGRGESERGSSPERHPPLLSPDPILENPGPLAATAQAQAEARHVIIEEDRVGLAGRQRDAADRGTTVLPAARTMTSSRRLRCSLGKARLLTEEPPFYRQHGP
jgi:hypothetical protein